MGDNDALDNLGQQLGAYNRCRQACASAMPGERERCDYEAEYAMRSLEQAALAFTRSRARRARDSQRRQSNGPTLLADEVEAVTNYRAALRASVEAGTAYAASPNVAEAQKRERVRDEASAKCFDARKVLDEVLRG
jgi:hypothetical protein